jgi:aspartate aminotransferase
MGVYRCNSGKPFILPSVREAEKRIFERNSDHEYAAIDGIKSFKENATLLAYGANSEVIAEGRLATCQSLSGTGSIRLGLDFLKEWYLKKNAKVFIPDPSWPTHKGIAERAGFPT